VCGFESDGGTVEMDNGFQYEGKTAVQSLQELCLLRKYPQPLFLDRSQGNQIMVTTVVGGKIYGSGENKTIAEACEDAAIATLSIWLKDQFDSSLLKKKPQSLPLEAPTNISSNNTLQNNAASDAQLNAVSILHIYSASVLYGAAPKPQYDLKKVDDKFVCELTIVHKAVPMKTFGDGKTKGWQFVLLLLLSAHISSSLVLAKRVAAMELLQ
jgi:hypothetical protein